MLEQVIFSSRFACEGALRELTATFTRNSTFLMQSPLITVCQIWYIYSVVTTLTNNILLRLYLIHSRIFISYLRECVGWVVNKSKIFYSCIVLKSGFLFLNNKYGFICYSTNLQSYLWVHKFKVGSTIILNLTRKDFGDLNIGDFHW